MPENPEALPVIKVDEPTLNMNFQVNTSPLAGKEGKFVTSRQIRERLQKELLVNVALRVEDTADADVFRVSGRGELHLTILIENMRREGFELAVSRPQVLKKIIDGVDLEPFEALTVDVEEDHQGAIMQKLGLRRGGTARHGAGRPRPRAPRIPHPGARPDRLPGRVHDHDARHRPACPTCSTSTRPIKGDVPERRNGVLISATRTARRWPTRCGSCRSAAACSSARRQAVYEGMIIGIHSRDNDLVVNPVKGKQLTNVRAAGKDEAMRADAADQADAGIRGRVHRRRRTGGGHAQVDPHPQALPQRARAQAPTDLHGSRASNRTSSRRPTSNW
jgi:GTP-binding protein